MTRQKKANGLTPKQRQFCLEYIIDLNATQAAIRAGYSKKRSGEIGWQLLQKTTIQQEIQRLMSKRSEKTEITADYVLTSLRAIAERCMQAEAVLDRDGNETGEYKFDSSGANKSLELLGKNLKLFTEKHEISGELKPMKVELVFKGGTNGKQ